MAIGLRETMVRSAGAVFALACAAVAAYAFTFLFRGFTAAGPLARQFAVSGLDVPAHFFGGGLALLLAPWQMSTRLRRRWPTLHRIGGGLYTGGVLIGGLAGLSLARHAQGGWASGSGFALLALAWLGVTATGIAHAVRGHHEAHRRWMWRSVALTASAVTLRITLGLGLGVLHLPFLTVYVFAAWSCWTINLAICETLLRTRFDPALASAVRVAQ